MLYAAIGLHPIHTGRSYHDADELGGGEAAKAFTSRGEAFDTEYYRALAEDPATVAIGECGLDYFHFNDDEPREAQIEKQKAAFLAQIDLSKEVEKPLMIHCRDAFEDLIDFFVRTRMSSRPASCISLPVRPMMRSGCLIWDFPLPSAVRSRSRRARE